MKPTAVTPKRALRHFGFRQTIRGAIILGVLTALMLTMQAVAYDKAYPDAASRAKFNATLTSVPSLGLLYGDAKNLEAGTTGYMVYRVVDFMGLIAGVYGMMTATRLLRGNEEDGRWEVIRSSATSARTAVSQVLLGFSAALVIAYVVSSLITMASLRGAGIDLPFMTNILVQAAIFLPGLLFAGLGVLVSQLALTRGRALMYGLTPVVAFFALRSLANTHANLHWLLGYTPFGWAMLLNPILGTSAGWLLPFALGTVMVLVLGIVLAQRDLGSSIFRQSESSRSHYYLLRTSWGLGLRQSGWAYAAWGVGAALMVSLLSSLSSIAPKVASDSHGLSKSINNLGGSQDLQIAFLGAGLLFLSMILLVMSVSIVGAIRRDEAKQYLDNILVQPQSRTRWLSGRIIVGLTAILVISLLCGTLLYGIAAHQHVTLSLAKVLASSLTGVGGMAFIIGLGTLLYGFVPRLASAALYLALVWSFVIILVASATKLNTILLHTSIFQYISFDLAHWPKWGTFAWLSVLGAAMAAMGIWRFNLRDIASE